MKRRHLIGLAAIAAAIGLGVVVWLGQAARDVKQRGDEQGQPVAERAGAADNTHEADEAPAPAEPSGPALQFVRSGRPNGVAAEAVVGTPGIYPPKEASIAAGEFLALPEPHTDTLWGQETSNYEVFARSADHEYGFWGEVSPDGLDEQPLRRVELAEASAVRVRVVGPGGEPVDGAEVRLSRGLVALVHLTQLTDADGAATFAAIAQGDYRLTVQAEGFVRRSRPLLHTSRPDEVRVELDRGATVRGRVIDTTGAPVPGARVATIPVSPFADETIDAEFLSQVGVASQQGLADDKGRFALGGIAVGAVRVHAQANGYAAGLSDTVRVGHGGSKSAGKIVLRRQALRQDLLVRVTPSDPEARVAAVELVAGGDQPHRCVGSHLRANDWRFSNCGVGERTLIATTDSGARARWQGRFDEATEVTVSVPRAVDLFVTDASGSPVNNALVQVWQGNELLFQGTSRGSQPIDFEAAAPLEATVVAFDARRGEGRQPLSLEKGGAGAKVVVALDQPLFSLGDPHGRVREVARIEQILGADLVRDDPSWLVDMVDPDSVAGQAGLQRGDRLVYVRRTADGYRIAAQRGSRWLDLIADGD